MLELIVLKKKSIYDLVAISISFCFFFLFEAQIKYLKKPNKLYNLKE